MSYRNIPHKAQHKYAQKQHKISQERKEELKQLAREMISYVITVTADPNVILGIKKLNAIARWCSAETNVIKNGVLEACNKANWALVLQEVIKDRQLNNLEIPTLEKILDQERYEQIKLWFDVDAIMLQVEHLEDATEEHYTFLEQAGDIINKVENESAIKGNPAILAIIGAYCADMQKERVQYFAKALESAFLTYQKITS